MTAEGIQSLGPPPERHADRVVAEMLRDLARKHAALAVAIPVAFGSSADGSPKAQAKMAERIRRAGAYHVQLYPGKRGRYQLLVHDFVGWDPSRNAEIGVDSPIPEKPWIACCVTSVNSSGGGRNHFDFHARGTAVHHPPCVEPQRPAPRYAHRRRSDGGCGRDLEQRHQAVQRQRLGHRAGAAAGGLAGAASAHQSACSGGAETPRKAGADRRHRDRMRARRWNDEAQIPAPAV